MPWGWDPNPQPGSGDTPKAPVPAQTAQRVLSCVADHEGGLIGG